LVLGGGGEQVPAGEEGVLHVAGPSVFSGYWGSPAETTTAFLLRDGTRWYNTGDIVKYSERDGLLFVGRRDRMVKRHGYRIELDELETCMYKHPDIIGAAVIAIHHPEAGTRIVSYMVSGDARRPSIVEMKSFCNQHLPGYMNPDVFVYLSDLPRTLTNKVDYQALVQAFHATV
jgi:acyl-CoA synthetase (AMP-forming)/AMP-acid ligase II